jgi:hypothetical protein
MKVLVLTVEGLQAAYLGCYGNDWIETPSLDRLAAQGVVFDRHFADAPDPAGARAGWRTGRCGLPSPDDPAPTAVQSVDLLDLLRARGVRSTLVVPDSTRRPDFAAGWEQVRRVPVEGGGVTALEPVLEATAAALEELAGTDQWLLWVELASLLPPWELPADFETMYLVALEEDEEEPLAPLIHPASGLLEASDDTTAYRAQRTYAAAVTFLDACLGQLLEYLQGEGLLEETLILLTTDRGFPLGEHGAIGECRPWLHEELVHLPLLLRLPGGQEAGRRASALTQPVDLMPTLLDAFRVQPPGTHGKNLLPLVRGEGSEPRAYACSGLRVGEEWEWSLRTADWAFLLPGPSPAGERPRGRQLYVKPDDRWEVNNVVQHHLDFADHLEATLRAFAATSRQPGPLAAPVLRDIQDVTTPGDVGPIPSA